MKILKIFLFSLILFVSFSAFAERFYVIKANDLKDVAIDSPRIFVHMFSRYEIEYCEVEKDHLMLVKDRVSEIRAINNSASYDGKKLKNLNEYVIYVGCFVSEFFEGRQLFIRGMHDSIDGARIRGHGSNLHWVSIYSFKYDEFHLLKVGSPK